MSERKKTPRQILGVQIGKQAGKRVAKSEAEKKTWKPRFNLSRKEKMILILPAAAAIVVVLAVVLLLDRSVTYTVDAAAAQYYANGTYPIAAETELCQDADGAFSMKTGRKQKQDLNNLPIYYSDRRSAVLPRSMVYFAPRTKVQASVDFFSEILCSENGAVRLIRDGKEPVLNPGFLYDGEDLYLFLEPVTLRVNGYALELPALSYVEAVYGGAVMVFNYETKEQLMEAPQGDVIAEIAGGDYSISLLGDSMTLHDGTKSLLFTRPDLLEPVVG